MRSSRPPRSPRRRGCSPPGGRLLIVDFAPHEREELRDRDAHVRLGFADEAMRGCSRPPGSTAASSSISRAAS